MCSFTPHFTQGGRALDSDANGWLDQVKVLLGPLLGSATKEPPPDMFALSYTTSQSVFLQCQILSTFT